MISDTSAAVQLGYDAMARMAVEFPQEERLILIIAKCRALLHGYDHRYAGHDYLVECPERLHEAPLVNPETERSSRTFRLAALLDLEVELNGRRFIVDWKTTSQEIKDPNSPYWRQLAIEGQCSHYLLLKWLGGEKADGAIWDVVRKPSIAPKSLTKALQKAVASLGEYCGRRVSLSNPSEWDGRETLEMYEARLAEDCTKVRPDWYFQQRSIPRLDKELLNYASEIWQHGQDMLRTRNLVIETNREPVMNPGACMLYGSPCKFLGICSGYDKPESDKWIRKQQVHVELPELEGDGRDVLTTSRVRCFQTCPRKHYYQYEVGIERIDEEEREALLFGTVWHVALAAWWSSFIPKEYGNGNDKSESCSAIGVGNRGDATQTAHVG